VPHKAAIGTDVVLGYGGLGIVIHNDAVIGDRVHIDQHVTIGGNGTRWGTPVIEADVYIGAGAKVLGPIVVGRGAVVGANAVVIRDVPAGAVAAGVPARLIATKVDVTQYLAHRRGDGPKPNKAG
jgi:serine O-acetyltransferase